MLSHGFLLHFLILQEDSTASGMEKFLYGRSFPGILYFTLFLFRDNNASILEHSDSP
ncbi:hypothetical cytosolic protein [Syntrophus aciditrophicus SB]|uniref:Hypothetical cytosolic protein n=1 Tax=Syntrophus aciditrophicus (strain SB) TaxID=56780 RepID=Q2LU80_SYNAS|nr:hypothetical cytosolic protein [Syntrophus aciditrophicus SB]